jgi:3'-phosphoadenosine 5'-phosphosulfate (PAPS) 3'-phosphatase
VVKGETDGLLYLRAANHKWDSCAGEAVLVALGGCFSDSQGNPILYDPQAKSTVNELGNICISDKALYQSIISELNLNSKI